jgi:hypothetical protein
MSAWLGGGADLGEDDLQLEVAFVVQVRPLPIAREVHHRHPHLPALHQKLRYRHPSSPTHTIRHDTTRHDQRHDTQHVD